MISCVNAKKKLRNNDIVIPKRNLKSTYPSVRRIIAIGDIHGDIKKLTYILNLSKNNENYYNYIFFSRKMRLNKS